MASGTGPRKKVPIDYKARLERKLYLARENPEPIFDLSECNLKNVPSNIFSLCKVFRKEALFLEKNQLSNISNGGSLKELADLKILNLSSNKFKKLPSDINALKNLEILDVSENELQELPDEIGSLQNLKCLNASYNSLKSLPYSIGNCQNLKELNVMFNKPLTKLPNSLGKLKHLEKLEFDPTILNPPKEVCQSGIQKILSFFRQEVLNDLETPSTSHSYHNAEKGKAILEETGLTKKETKSKVEKKTEHLMEEKNLMNEKIREKNANDLKNKLLADLKNEEIALDEKLAKLQEQKSNERALLVKLCQKEEENSTQAVCRILSQNKKLQRHILNEDIKIWNEEEKRLMSSRRLSELNDPSLKLQILASMDETIKEEVKKFQSSSEKKNLCTIKSLAAEISFNNECLQKLIKKTDESKKQLVNAILDDEELQKSAVFSLLEKTDATSWKLAKEISIVENQLAELTRLELSKKKLVQDQHLAELNKNQHALTKLLMDLMDEQKERRKQLIERIQEMEIRREENRDASNFWLNQYDLLLHSKSNEIVKFLEALNPHLVHELFMNGVFQYLPLLKDIALDEEKLENLNLNTLKKLGIKNSKDRDNILYSIQCFLHSERTRKRIPSAPESEEPSAPLLNNNSDLYKNMSIKYLVPEECVICLDSKPNVVFVPCGHICCCYNCFKEIKLCPMCRKPIEEAHETLGL